MVTTTDGLIQGGLMGAIIRKGTKRMLFARRNIVACSKSNVIGAAAILFIASQAVPARAQQPPKVATDITAGEIQEVLDAPGQGADRQLKVVNIGSYNVSVGALRRGKTKPGAPVGAINHEHVTEVYYIISGTGTLLTGGTVENVRAAAADSEIVKVAVGPSNNATFRQPAQSRKVGPGDMVIIPAGVYHGFTDVTDHIEYVSVRSDPNRVLPAGYVNPALGKGASGK
jgi:mannose-6-phosphate isomerase-like protein (cupin superfamily)